MNIIDREAAYIALGPDHAGKPLEQPGTLVTTDTERAPAADHKDYYAKHHISSDAFLDFLAAGREEAVKPH